MLPALSQDTTFKKLPMLPTHKLTSWKASVIPVFINSEYDTCYFVKQTVASINAPYISPLCSGPFDKIAKNQEIHATCQGISEIETASFYHILSQDGRKDNKEPMQLNSKPEPLQCSAAYGKTKKCIELKKQLISIHNPKIMRIPKVR